MFIVKRELLILVSLHLVARICDLVLGNGCYDTCVELREELFIITLFNMVIKLIQLRCDSKGWRIVKSLHGDLSSVKRCMILWKIMAHWVIVPIVIHKTVL